MKDIKKILLIFFGFIFSIPNANCLNSSLSDTLKTKNQILAYPIIFLLPETGWGLGGAGFYNFRFRDESAESNPSQIQFTLSVTQKKQFLFTIPFEIYINQNLWKFKGELSYYRYLYNFYGIGIDSKFSDRETFNADYPRFRVDMLRRYSKMFLGLRLRYDNVHLFGKKENGLLEKSILKGTDGGTSLGIGFVAQLDTRNYIYNPTQGFFGEAEIFVNDQFIFSDFRYTRYSLDLAKYTKIGDQQTLALQIFTSSIIGNPFFYDLSFFGSPRLMRGFQDRRFKDSNIFVVQSEYRFPLYKRLQAVSFLSTGSVADRYTDVFRNEFKISYGAGLRFILNQKDRIRLRVDYGRTINEGGNLYITINDAF